MSISVTDYPVHLQDRMKLDREYDPYTLASPDGSTGWESKFFVGVSKKNKK